MGRCSSHWCQSTTQSPTSYSKFVAASHVQSPERMRALSNLEQAERWRENPGTFSCFGSYSRTYQTTRQKLSHECGALGPYIRDQMKSRWMFRLIEADLASAW